jgi:HAMP domain-containing protein
MQWRLLALASFSAFTAVTFARGELVAAVLAGIVAVLSYFAACQQYRQLEERLSLARGDQR